MVTLGKGWELGKGRKEVGKIFSLNPFVIFNFEPYNYITYANDYIF